ncbi:MAG: hypothetical protein WAS21_27785 [Geminicoccaceae bacterium]
MVVLAALCLAVASSSDGAEPTPGQAIVMSDAELGARLHFLESRLDAGRPTALAWEWGWSGAYAASFVGNSIYAVSADEADDRVRAIVDAAKSGLATIQMATLLLHPLAAGLGAEPMREVPGDDRSARQLRLAVGERQLLTTATRAETRFNLRRHLVTIGANLIGGAAIATFGDSGDAVRSTLIGIAVGEAEIWSQPWRATGDLRDYQAQFPGSAGLTWELRPMGTGVQVAFHF